MSHQMQQALQYRLEQATEFLNSFKKLSVTKVHEAFPATTATALLTSS